MPKSFKEQQQEAFQEKSLINLTSNKDQYVPTSLPFFNSSASKEAEQIELLKRGASQVSRQSQPQKETEKTLEQLAKAEEEQSQVGPLLLSQLEKNREQELFLFQLPQTLPVQAAKDHSPL